MAKTAFYHFLKFYLIAVEFYFKKIKELILLKIEIIKGWKKKTWVWKLNIRFFFNAQKINLISKLIVKFKFL